MKNLCFIILILLFICNAFYFIYTGFNDSNLLRMLLGMVSLLFTMYIVSEAYLNVLK